MARIDVWSVRFILIGLVTLLIGGVLDEIISSGITMGEIFRMIQEEMNLGIFMMFIGLLIAIVGGIFGVIAIHRNNKKE